MNAIRPRHQVPIPLRHLVPTATTNPQITGVTLDSRAVQPGWIYAALPGNNTHGARFAESACRLGAAAILTDKLGSEIIGDSPIPVVVFENVRAQLGRISAGVFGSPADAMRTFGVTGTNGKTTTVALLSAALAAAGCTPATVGTLGFICAGNPVESARTTVTTPEAPDLQALLALFKQSGADSVALEVSSHALELHRVSGITFTAAGFLNLGHDHLDFHGSQEAYFAAKRQLFEPERSQRKVVWLDEYGRMIADDLRALGTEVVTVGYQDADYTLCNYAPSGRLGGKATVRRYGEELHVELALPGEYNMIDAAVALAMLESDALDTIDLLTGLASAQVSGRMERVIFDDTAPLVIVDFAHTPQAVKETLRTLAKFGELTTVLGCGGDRDARKRPVMGKVAAELSDRLIITDDNPRSEDPAVIRAAMLSGARGGRASVVEIGDRAEAIEHAIASSPAQGVVAILGKGHETGQEISGRVIDFSDAEVARRSWGRIKGEQS